MSLFPSEATLPVPLEDMEGDTLALVFLGLAEVFLGLVVVFLGLAVVSLGPVFGEDLVPAAMGAEAASAIPPAKFTRTVNCQNVQPKDS